MESTTHPEYFQKRIDGQVYSDVQARKAIDQIVQKYRDESEETDRAITTRARKILAEEMPIECYVASTQDPEGVYVPARIMDYLASAVFGDRWSSEIVEIKDLEHIVSVNFNASGTKRTRTKAVAERRVKRFQATARVRVKVVAPNGREQSHEGMGLSSFDVEPGSVEEVNARTITIKGSVSDARRQALSHFGRLLNPRGQDRDTLLARVAADALNAPPPPSRAHVAPVKRKVLGYPLFNEGSQKIAEYPGNLNGAARWIEGYQEIIEAQETGPDMDAIINANAVVLSRIEQDFSKDLQTRLQTLSDAMDAHVLNQAGYGGVSLVSSDPVIAGAHKDNLEAVWNQDKQIDGLEDGEDDNGITGGIAAEADQVGPLSFQNLAELTKKETDLKGDVLEKTQKKLAARVNRTQKDSADFAYTEAKQADLFDKSENSIQSNEDEQSAIREDEFKEEEPDSQYLSYAARPLGGEEDTIQTNPDINLDALPKNAIKLKKEIQRLIASARGREEAKALFAFVLPKIKDTLAPKDIMLLSNEAVSKTN